MCGLKDGERYDLGMERARGEGCKGTAAGSGGGERGEKGERGV